MENINLGTVAIPCPRCGNTQLSQGDTPETEDEATCAKCGHRFSLDAEVGKIGDAVTEAVADMLRKALK